MEAQAEPAQTSKVWSRSPVLIRATHAHNCMLFFKKHFPKIFGRSILRFYFMNHWMGDFVFSFLKNDFIAQLYKLPTPLRHIEKEDDHSLKKNWKTQKYFNKFEINKPWS